jgi:hypothetical protein
MSILHPPHPHPQPEHIAAEQKEKLQIRRITNALRATWRMPLITSIILLVLTVAILLLLRIMFPPTRIFLSQFHFTFPAVGSGRYPNDVPFSINEILDPAILDGVYDQLELDKYGVERNQFYGAFSIRPIKSETSERYGEQLADPHLLSVERERLERRLTNQLSQDSRDSVELSFIPPLRTAIPIPVGRATVHKVPLVWSQLAIEKKGVLRIPGFTSGANLIAPEAINQQPLPLVIVALVEASHRLDDRLRELLKVPAVLTVRDPASGKSIRDLDRDVRDLQLFHVSPLGAQLVNYRFDDGGSALKQLVERRINDIEIQAAGLARQAEAVGDSLTQFVQVIAAVRGRPVERRPADTEAATGGGGGAVVPQVGENFIYRIIELTRQDRHKEQVRLFIDDRTQMQFGLKLSAIELRSEQDQWKELLANLQLNTVARKDLDEATRGQMERELRYAIDETNADWAALSRMETEFAASHTGRTAEIYAPPDSDVVSNDLILNTRMLAMVFSGLTIFFLGFWGCRAAALFTRP